MRLTACVIVKNEQNNIKRWLNCMQQIADELVVIDTGSTDDTINIVKKNSMAQIYKFNWCNDFSAAKNYAISKATGDWIVFLDADEFFTQKSINAVRKNIIAIKTNIKVFMCKLSNLDENGNIKGSVYLVRGFRNEKGIYYKGRVHEQLFYNDKEITDIAFIQEIEIYHTGYVKEKITEKLQRNLELIETEIRLNGDNPRYYAALADCYYGLAQYSKAIIYAQKFIESGLKTLGGENQIYYTLISALYLQGKGEVEIRKILKKYNLDMTNGQVIKLKNYANNKIFISACVIVKNEEKNIQHYIDNISDIVDEIIIVDTGSSDNTKKIAIASGAKIHDFVWNDDFAAAKNYAIEKAQGKWIIFLDADEYIPFQYREKLLNYIKKYDKDNNVDAITCKMINIDSDRNNRFISSFYQLRVFRNVPEIYYAGKIHESLQRKNGKKIRMVVLKNDVQIMHTGYSSAIMKAKNERNLALIRQDMKNGERPEHYSYLADCYYGLSDYEKTIYYSKKFIKTGIMMIGAETNIYTRLIDSLSLSGRSTEEILQAIDLAIAKFPSMPDFIFMKGFFLFKQQHYLEAEHFIQQTFKLWRNGNEQITLSIMEHLSKSIYAIAGLLEEKKDNIARAIPYYIRSLQDDPYNVQIFTRLYGLLSGKKQQVIKKMLDKIYMRSNDANNFLMKILMKYKVNDLLLEYCTEKNEYTLMAQKKYIEASNITANDLKKLYLNIMAETLAGNEPEKYEMVKIFLPLEYKIIFIRAVEKFTNNMVRK